MFFPLTLGHTYKSSESAFLTKPIKYATQLKEPVIAPQGLVEAVYVAPIVQPVVSSDEFYMNYIFSHEGSLDSINSIGCKGEGQDCNGQLVIDCPNWQTDKPCQDAFFDKYALARYGSWQAAYNFKISNGWW